jgi:hypothetical protein
MQINKEKWEIEELINERNSIDPKPQYQRTSVWTTDRKSYLIDSILRGYDLPKFYFTYDENRNSKGFKYEVADGQQRIRAIWEFRDDGYSIKKNTIIGDDDISLLKYSELPKKYKELFLKYELNISNILSHESGEINDLFTRLQKGVTLNPPELRHAMLSNIGTYIDKFVGAQQNSGFFSLDTKITDTRFKHQEYIDHIITLAHFKYSKDLKAATMTQLYIDFAEQKEERFITYFKNAKKVLGIMGEMNNSKKGIFKNKWAFVDTFWYIYKNIKSITKFDITKMANAFIEFENERKKYNSEPEKLLKIRNHKYGKILFAYIQAFNKEGANKDNVKVRAEVFDQVFDKCFQ